MDNNRVQIPIPQTPREFVQYWFDYGRCLACRQSIRHEMHLHNHWKKYHRMLRVQYYFWKDGQWSVCNTFTYAIYKAGTVVPRRPVAVERLYV